MPDYWNKKDERQYGHILDSCLDRGRYGQKRCKSMAAATVNQRRSDEGRTLGDFGDVGVLPILGLAAGAGLLIAMAGAGGKYSIMTIRMTLANPQEAQAAVEMLKVMPARLEAMLQQGEVAPENIARVRQLLKESKNSTYKAEGPYLYAFVRIPTKDVPKAREQLVLVRTMLQEKPSWKIEILAVEKAA